MDMDFLNKMGDVHSFVVLQEIFESWVNEGVINERTLELQLGYTSLIVYPAIYLTKDGAKREIAAAKVCYDILITYAKDEISNKLKSDDEKTVLSTLILTLPPEKSILTLCSEFYHLLYFLEGLYKNYTDEQLANINGDDYAKVWLNIFSKGYHFDHNDKAFNEDLDYLNKARIFITKMHLSLDYKEKLDAEKIKTQFDEYYHVSKNNSSNNSGTGCLFSIIMFIIASIMVACI